MQKHLLILLAVSLFFISCEVEEEKKEQSFAPLKKIEIPDTGDWQIWKTFKVDGLSLQAGKQVLRATIGDTDYLNLNYMIFSLEESNSLSVDNSRPFQISIKEGHLKVQGAETTTHIRVHDLRGRLVAEFGTNGGKLPNTAKGVLLVSLVSANNATSHYKMKNLQ